MSVPSSNTTVTTERPYFETERISSTFGMPAIARSTATVTYCSTSVGDSAGAGVITWTCTLVTSGTASIGRSIAERTPTITSRVVARRTMARLRSDHATSALRNLTSLLLAERSFENRALEREDAVDDDLLTDAQAAQDLDASPGAVTDGDGVQLEVSVSVADEHHVLGSNACHRRQRNDDTLRGRLRRADDDPGRAEQADLHQVAVVRDQDAGGDGAGCRIEVAADGLGLRVGHLVRVGVEADLRARTDLHARQILLEQPAEEVGAIQIADRGDDVFGGDG